MIHPTQAAWSIKGTCRGGRRAFQYGDFGDSRPKCDDMMESKRQTRPDADPQHCQSVSYVRIPTNVQENETVSKVQMDVAGFKAHELSVKLDGGILSIAGERTNSFAHKSRFNHSFLLDESSLETGQLVADLSEGVLTISVPKKAVLEDREIIITSSEAERDALNLTAKEAASENYESSELGVSVAQMENSKSGDFTEHTEEEEGKYQKTNNGSAIPTVHAQLPLVETVNETELSEECAASNDQAWVDLLNSTN